MKTLAKVLVATTVLSLLAGCQGNKTVEQTPTAVPTPPTASSPTPQTAAGGATKINVTEKDFKIVLSSDSAPAGPVEFVTQNQGPSPHELLVVQTDLAPDKLPIKDGEVDEDAPGIKVIDEIDEDDLKVGTSKTLRVNLTPGKYLLICNVKGHPTAGMVTAFTVK